MRSERCSSLKERAGLVKSNKQMKTRPPRNKARPDTVYFTCALLKISANEKPVIPVPYGPSSFPGLPSYCRPPRGRYLMPGLT